MDNKCSLKFHILFSDRYVPFFLCFPDLLLHFFQLLLNRYSCLLPNQLLCFCLILRFIQGRNDIAKNVTYRVPSTEPYKDIDNTCRTAIEVPPIPADAFNNEATKQSQTVIDRLNHILPGQNAFTADLPEELRLNIKGARISQIYKRLDPDKPSYTVTGSGGGGTHIYHWAEPRALTNRERARLQTFPDTYEFLGNKESVRKQIGMAVPCRGAQIIFEAILRSFAGIDYLSIDANIDE